MDSQKKSPIKLYCMSIGALDDPETFQRYYREMSAERRAKIDRIRMSQDKKLSLAAGILLDCGLQEFGLRGRTIRVEEGTYGKPFFPDLPNIHFSLSHSHEMAFAVFADTEAGCDIEYRKKPNEKLAGRFFCPEENAWMMAARTETEGEERFYRLWTLKESFIKATGQGLRQPLDSFCFRIEDTHVPQSEIGDKTRQGNIPAVELRRRNSSVTVTQTFDQAEYVFEEYSIGRDGEYCAAVCLRYQCL